MDRGIGTAEQLRETELMKDMERLNLGTAEEVVAEADRLHDIVNPLVNSLVDKRNSPDMKRRPPTNSDQSRFMAALMLETHSDFKTMEDALYGFMALCALSNVAMRKVKELQELEDAIHAD